MRDPVIRAAVPCSARRTRLNRRNLGRIFAGARRCSAMASTIELLDEHNSLLTQWPCDAAFCAALATGEHAATTIPRECGRDLADRVVRVRCVDKSGRTFEGSAFVRTRQ